MKGGELGEGGKTVNAKRRVTESEDVDTNHYKPLNMVLHNTLMR